MPVLIPNLGHLPFVSRLACKLWLVPYHRPSFRELHLQLLLDNHPIALALGAVDRQHHQLVALVNPNKLCQFSVELVEVPVPSKVRRDKCLRPSERNNHRTPEIVVPERQIVRLIQVRHHVAVRLQIRLCKVTDAMPPLQQMICEQMLPAVAN